MNIDAFAERLKACLAGSSVNGFAKKCDMSEGLMRRYLAGQSLPGLDKLVVIAKAASINIEWLATGEGPMRPGEPIPTDEQTPPESPAPQSKEFSLRMGQIAQLVGSANALAKKAGISQGGIRRYFEGGEPSMSILISLAKAAGVEVLWLATGEGPMRPGEITQSGSTPPSAEKSLNPQLLQAVIKAVRESIALDGSSLTPAQEAEIITGVYEMFLPLPPGSPISITAIRHLLSALRNGSLPTS